MVSMKHHHSQRRFSLHTAILVAFFTAGGALTAGGEQGIGVLEWLTAGMISSLLLMLIIVIVRHIPFCNPETGKTDRSAVSLIFAVITAAVSLEVSVSAVNVFASLTIETMLRRSTGILPVLLLIIPAMMICRSAKGIVKFAPAALILGFPIFIILFAASFNAAAVTETISNLTFSIENLPLIYAESFAFTGLVVLCAKKAGAILSGSSSLGSVAGGTAAGMVCIQVITQLGGVYAANLSFPYMKAISAITLGGSLTRPDGFGYTLVYLCQLIRLSAAGSAFLAAAEPFFGERKLPSVLFFALTGILCIIFGSI